MCVSEYIHIERRPSGDRPYSSAEATEACIAFCTLDVLPPSREQTSGKPGMFSRVPTSKAKTSKHDSIKKHFPIRRLAAPFTRCNLLFLSQPLLWEHHVSRNEFLKISIGKSTHTYNVLCIYLFCRSRPTIFCLVTCTRIYAQNMCEYAHMLPAHFQPQACQTSVKLNNGNQMPMFGLGVFKADPGQSTYRCVSWRHVMICVLGAWAIVCVCARLRVCCQRVCACLCLRLCVYGEYRIFPHMK